MDVIREMFAEYPMPPAVATAIYYLTRAVMAYGTLILVFPIFAVYQEWKIWASSPTIPNLSPLGCIKVYLFNVIWFTWTFVGSLLLLPLWLLGGCGNSVEKLAHCVVERHGARVCIAAMAGPVVVRGAEHLPPDVSPPGQPAPVYVANHSSQIDVGAVYYLFRRFKWIAKQSVIYLPGVGQIMHLSGHVFIKRTGKNKGSISNLYVKSNEAVQSGVPMFLFPQGTRRLAQRMPFKDGAFNIAIENETQIVPISIDNPLGAFNDLYPLSLLWGGGRTKEPIVMTVHRPIQCRKDTDKAKLKQECYDIIYSVLPDYRTDEEKKRSE
uniref:Phospholipid/glycerol acyltransferase domain-containing protein n=1 Tax=Minutocellus polymorphus TaxID=265543 RepID=A0A7S0FSA7_9STRA|mmetsp:Transcript_8088/g.13387  ORF Transcript_8088/g.13387 Transcript_8088/m.13387 type:complete len:324 (+) Transcript_8088:290-1261(+)